MSLDKLENYLDTELKKLRLLEDAKEMIVAIKSHKQVALEAKGQKETALKEKEAILKQTNDAKAELDSVKKSLAAEKDKAGVEANSILNKAKQEAQQIHAKAVLFADSLTVKIKEKEEKILLLDGDIADKTAILNDAMKAKADIDKKIRAMAGA